MRKLTVLFIILLSAAGVLQAQKGTAVKNMGKAVTKSSGKGSAGAMVKTPKGPRNLPVTGRVRAGSVVAPAQGNTQSRALTNPQTVRTDATTLEPQAYTGVAKVGVLSSKEGQAAILDKAKQQAERVEELVTALEKRAELKKLDERLQTGIGKSVLLSPMPQRATDGSYVPGGYSVTVIKNNYNGEEEIFGVIATHTIPTNVFQKGMLGKHFQVQIKDAFTGKDTLYGAEVVAFSPASMLDISLVKFDEEVEYVAEPLEIEPAVAQKNEVLFPMGFAASVPTIPAPRVVQNNSFLSVRTNQTIEGDRQGFCGSPLLDASGKVKAIHTGTKEVKGDRDAVSYATHAKFINVLIDSYHNNGKAMYDLEIDGRTLARLNADEYVDYIGVYNAEGKLVAQENIETGTKDTFPKFSQSSLRSMLASNPDSVYLLLRTRAKRWNANGTALVNVKQWNGKKNIDPTKRDNWYNLQTKQIEPTRPAVIKM